jgi:hypothetical protein
VSETPFAPINDADLKAAAEARTKRRAEFAKLVQDAGMDPAQIDVTKIMNDEEQSRVIEQMAANKKAKELAEIGRKALKERLKTSLQVQQSCVERQTMRHTKQD